MKYPSGFFMLTRLLAIDIDGTLLTGERIPHPENVAAFDRAAQAGIQVVLASGRIALSIRDFNQKLGLNGPMICCNGGHVQLANGEDIVHATLDQDAVDITLAYVAEAGVHVNAYTKDLLYFNGESQWAEMYRQRVRIIRPDVVSSDEIRKMNLLKLILIDEPKNIPIHRREMEKRLNLKSAALTESEPEYLEVLSPNANKGLGLKALSEALGLQQGETAAIGDYLNDIEMIQWAGVGAAMGNALPEVKQAANLVVPTNEEAGVAFFIDHLIERNRQASSG